jgi:phosphatidylglycerophosphate synthase
MIASKKLDSIITYKPNIITLFRLIMLFVSVIIYPSAPKQACLLLMISVVLDYIDGIIARKYN